MSRNPYASVLYQMSALLSQRVSDQDNFFKEIALMDISSKKAYAILYVINEIDLLNLDIESMTDKEIIEEIILPIIQRIGQANYRADVLTNLGWKVGLTKKILDWDIP